MLGAAWPASSAAQIVQRDVQYWLPAQYDNQFYKTYPQAARSFYAAHYAHFGVYEVGETAENAFYVVVGSGACVIGGSRSRCGKNLAQVIAVGDVSRLWAGWWNRQTRGTQKAKASYNQGSLVYGKSNATIARASHSLVTESPIAGSATMDAMPP
ncbi:MAG: hypothetical protein O7I93_18540 [Gemmatimonadetes bacterium]|nr:hypothetical protein [Gemmatimonadota bacterium]